MLQEHSEIHACCAKRLAGLRMASSSSIACSCQATCTPRHADAASGSEGGACTRRITEELHATKLGVTSTWNRVACAVIAKSCPSPSTTTRYLARANRPVHNEIVQDGGLLRAGVLVDPGVLCAGSAGVPERGTCRPARPHLRTPCRRYEADRPRLLAPAASGGSGSQAQRQSSLGASAPTSCLRHGSHMTEAGIAE